MRIPAHPFIVEKLPTLVSGVDFLGLGAVNERLIATFLPGINNVTRHMRVYSVMCWMAWRFEMHFKEEGEALSTREIRELFTSFKEKIELLFTWGNQGRDIGIVGSRREFVREGTQTLKFSELGANRASWLDAVQYGPSLKSGNGLGFLTTAVGSTLRPTQIGTNLAQAIDGVLKHSRYYARLCDLHDNTATPDMAEDLGQLWSIHDSSIEERQVFAEAFAPFSLSDPPLGAATRCAAVRLIWSALRKSGGSGTPQDVRETLARASLRADTNFVRLEDRPTLCIWIVLQVRQLQRLCHEGLLRWIESVLVHGHFESARSTARLARVCGSLVLKHLNLGSGATVEQLTSEVKNKLGSYGSPLHAGGRIPEVDLFEHARTMINLGHSPEAIERLPSLAVYGLALVFVQAEALESDELFARPLALGARDRISISTLVELFRSYSGKSLEDFVVMLIESCTVGQHFATAAARLEQDKNKNRFIPCEEGLRPLITPAQVQLLGSTLDRLDVAMQLMGDCGLLHWSEDDHKYFLPKIASSLS